MKKYDNKCMEELTFEEVLELINLYKLYKNSDSYKYNEIVETFLKLNGGYIYIIKSQHLIENISIEEAQGIFFESLDTAINKYKESYKALFSGFLFRAIQNTLSRKFKLKTSRFNKYLAGGHPNIDILDISFDESVLIYKDDEENFNVMESLAYEGYKSKLKENELKEDSILIAEGIKEGLKVYTQINPSRASIVDMYYMYYIDPMYKTVEEILQEHLLKHKKSKKAVKEICKMMELREYKNLKKELTLKDIGKLFGKTGQQVKNNIQTLNNFIVPYLLNHNSYKHYLEGYNHPLAQ